MGNECQAACQRTDYQHDIMKQSDISSLADKQQLYLMLVKDSGNVQIKQTNHKDQQQQQNKKKKTIFGVERQTSRVVQDKADQVLQDVFNHHSTNRTCNNNTINGLVNSNNNDGYGYDDNDEVYSGIKNSWSQQIDNRYTGIQVDNSNRYDMLQIENSSKYSPIQMDDSNRHNIMQLDQSVNPIHTDRHRHNMINIKNISLDDDQQQPQQCRNGVQEYKWQNGEEYYGEWIDDKMQGVGKYNYHGDRVYIGFYYQNNRHGYGEYKCHNSSMYKGEWKNDRKHGYGIFYEMSDGQEKYGVWKNDTHQYWIDDGNVIEQIKQQVKQQSQLINQFFLMNSRM